MKILISYADKIYIKAQQKNAISGFENGNFDCVIKYNKSHIDDVFYNKNKHILDQERGAGYWLWKPYFIYKTMEKMDSNDILFYCDAGHSFYNKIDHLIPELEKSNNKMLLTIAGQKLSEYTKRDCFYYMGHDTPDYHEAKSPSAAFIILKKNKFTLNVIKEWLDYGQDYRIITDSKNECGKENLPNFKDHRHDQSILAILAKKYNITQIIGFTQYEYDNPDKVTPYQIVIYSGRHNTE
jgi:hypothetical protein